MSNWVNLAYENPQRVQVIRDLPLEQYFNRPYVDDNNRFSFRYGSSNINRAVLFGRTVDTATTQEFNQDVEVGSLNTAAQNLYYYRNTALPNGANTLVFDAIAQIGSTNVILRVTQRIGGSTTTLLDTTSLANGDTDFTRIEVAVGQPSQNGNYFSIYLQRCGLRCPPDLGLKNSFGKFAVFL